MPIVNEIDEQNPVNNRTIDTNTGVYLKLLGFDKRDRDSFFLLSNEGVEICFTARKSWKEDIKSNVWHFSYFVDQISLPKVSNLRDLKNIIHEFLIAHGDDFRSIERKRGLSEVGTIDFSHTVSVKISKWEELDD